jgi:hypothetical protein
MNELINGLMQKVGLSEEQAKKAVAFLKDNAQRVPGWLASSGAADKIPGGLGGAVSSALGGGEKTERK